MKQCTFNSYLCGTCNKNKTLLHSNYLELLKLQVGRALRQNGELNEGGQGEQNSQITSTVLFRYSAPVNRESLQQKKKT